MELIDKNELVKSFWRGVEEGDICSFEDTEDFIKNAPTVDAVPVVRCKDCKWFAPNNDGSWIGCAFDTRCPEDAPKADDFCSYAEPRPTQTTHPDEPKTHSGLIEEDL